MPLGSSRRIGPSAASAATTASTRRGGGRGPRGQADSARAGQPFGIDLIGAVHQVGGRARAAGDFDQAQRVGGVGRADHQHHVGVRGHVADRALPVGRRVADVRARRLGDAREASRVGR